MAVEVPDDVAPVFAKIKALEEPAYLVLSVDAENKKKVNLTATGRCGMAHLTRFLSEDQVSRRLRGAGHECTSAQAAIQALSSPP